MGIQLFKYIAQNVNEMGAYMIKIEDDKHTPAELYIRKYKPIGIIMQIATNTIASRLVNFNIMERYHDKDFENFFETIFTLIYIVPEEEVAAYLKVLNFFCLID